MLALTSLTKPPPSPPLPKMCQVSLMSLLLLVVKVVDFEHPYEMLLRGWPLLQGLFVFLPLLSVRAGFSGEQALEQAQSEMRWPVIDALALALYCTAVAALFFGSSLDRVFRLGAPAFYTGVLGGM